MKKLIILLSMIITALVAVLTLSIQSLLRKNADIERLTYNQEVLFDSIHSLKALDGINVYQIGRLEMSRKEFSRINTDLNREIENMRIKMKRLESADRIETVTKYVFVPDTIYADAEKKRKTLFWADAWLTFSIDSTGVNIESQDTIYVVRHQKVKKFLWWVRKRDLFISVENRNPHTHATKIESITIE